MQAAWHGKAPQWCDAVTLFRARTYKVSFVNSAVHVRFAPAQHPKSSAIHKLPADYPI